MGTLRFLKCKACNAEWAHYQGIGFLQIESLYCDTCGIHREESDETTCSCGGSFIPVHKKFKNVICPNCQSKKNDLGVQELLWD